MQFQINLSCSRAYYSKNNRIMISSSATLHFLNQFLTITWKHFLFTFWHVVANLVLCILKFHQSFFLFSLLFFFFAETTTGVVKPGIFPGDSFDVVSKKHMISYFEQIFYQVGVCYLANLRSTMACLKLGLCYSKWKNKTTSN